MNITEAQNINLLDNKTTDIVVDTITKDEFQKNPNIDVVLLGYDTFGNFLFKRKFDGEQYQFFYDSPTQLVQQIQQIVNEEELNSEGLYTIEYYFVNDDLKNITRPENRFLVTEISADRTEVRLNPLNNNKEFIDRFNEFKQYRKIVDTDEADFNVPVSEIVDSYIKSLLDKFYTEIQIDTIVDNLRIILPSSQAKPTLKSYISTYYPNNINNIVEHIKLRIRESKSRVETRFKQFLGSAPTNAAVQTYRILLDNFFSEPNKENAEAIERQIFNIFKTNFANMVMKELDLKIDDGQFGEGTQQGNSDRTNLYAYSLGRGTGNAGVAQACSRSNTATVWGNADTFRNVTQWFRNSQGDLFDGSSGFGAGFYASENGEYMLVNETGTISFVSNCPN
jgi:hypothetical protein